MKLVLKVTESTTSEATAPPRQKLLSCSLQDFLEKKVKLGSSAKLGAKHQKPCGSANILTTCHQQVERSGRMSCRVISMIFQVVFIGLLIYELFLGLTSAKGHPEETEAFTLGNVKFIKNIGMLAVKRAPRSSA